VIWTWKKKIEPLSHIDHSTISYKPFNKTLYLEHGDISALTPQKVFELRVALDIRIFGQNVPKPVTSFAHFPFDKTLINRILKSEFEKPTPIQSQAIPAALQGRDVLGLAKTGSGKTAAYLWPCLHHILNQNELVDDEGPIALIVVPTRELAIQVYQQSIFYFKPYNINVVCAYGGGSKYEQTKALEQSVELVVCTPGRIIDLIKSGATNFLRTTFLVFDEVDRMFDLGFEPQVSSISDHIRPDRQCLMFSATMKQKIEKLAINILNDPIKIICGDVSEASEDVQQTVIVLSDLQAKFEWVYTRIIQFITMGKVLIFVTKKLDAEDVAKKLKLRDIDLVLLHGDMHQHERNERMTAFRCGKKVLVATDVAARGLDITDIKNVINFDVARDVETHIHRVGRTGRAGEQGFAYTLITEKDSEFGAHLVQNLETTGQHVSQELIKVALKCPWFKKRKEEQSIPSILSIKQKVGFGFKNKDPSDFSKSGASHFSNGSTFISSQPSISKTIDKAKSMINSGESTGMNKIDLMRSALRGTYKHAFQRASEEKLESQLPASDPRPEWRKKLEERTERINQAIKLQEPATLQFTKSENSASKKHSRWE